LTFDVATVRPSADFNSPAMQAAMRAGNMPKFGANIEGLRAEYNQMQLRDLIANAYEVKTYQVSGPDVLTGQRFDIAARLPEGSSASDAPKMLQALLADRFKLEVTAKTEDRAVLGLIVGKNGPKMKSVPAPPPLDDKAELAPGQRKIDTPIGPAIMTMRQNSGGGMGGQTMNMGSKGTMTFTPKMEGQSFTLHMEFSGVTMPALATMLSQFLMGGGYDGAYGELRHCARLFAADEHGRRRPGWRCCRRCAECARPGGRSFEHLRFGAEDGAEAGSAQSSAGAGGGDACGEDADG
jgi:uncharacterized protein (TIGR03435 family)